MISIEAARELARRHPERIVGGFIHEYRQYDGSRRILIELSDDTCDAAWVRVVRVDPNGWPPLRAGDV